MEDASGDAEGSEWPKELVLRNCALRPELNGTFVRARDFDQSQHGRPVYMRRLAEERRVLCFFWEFGAVKGKAKKRKKGERGWWLGSELGGKLVIGCCASEDELPPSKGWSMKPGDEKAFEATLGCGFGWFLKVFGHVFTSGEVP